VTYVLYRRKNFRNLAAAAGALRCMSARHCYFFSYFFFACVSLNGDVLLLLLVVYGRFS
jgi:hypothetical protein